MRILLLTALLTLPESAASVPAGSAPLFSAPAASEPVISVPGGEKGVINPNQRDAAGLCPRTAAQMAADRAAKAGGSALFHKLTELPPGNAYVAVYRQIDGCEAPIVIRYDVRGSKGAAHK